MPRTDFVFMQTCTTAWLPLVQGTIQEPAGLPPVFGKAGLLVERGVAEWGNTVVVTRPLHSRKPLVR